MPRPLYRELYFAFLRAYRTIVPLSGGREVVSIHNVHHRFAFVVPFFFMAYLARRKDTYHMRLLLLPIVLVLAIRGTFAFGGSPGPEGDFDAWLRSYSCFVIVAKSLDYAFTREGHMKVGETTLLSLHDDEIKGVYIPAANSFLPSALADASELVFSLRGIGWNFGTRIYVPPMPEYTRNSFILHTFLHGLNNFLLFDLTLTLIINIPGLGSVDGGSMFFENLPPVQRYFVSSVIMLLVAVQFVAGFAVTDSMTALVGVGILQQDPKEWPPIMEAPWAADSLHDFWGRRWHQTLRHIFFVYGGMPGQLIAGKAGMVIGSFFASALYHELGMYLIDRPFDYRAVLFFLLNGVGVVFEWVFYKLSGRRVSGIIGRIWAWVFVLGFGQMLIDSWFVRGLGGSQVLPLESSPTRMFLAPILEPFLASDVRPALEKFLS